MKDYRRKWIKNNVSVLAEYYEWLQWPQVGKLSFNKKINDKFIFLKINYEKLFIVFSFYFSGKGNDFRNCWNVQGIFSGI